MGPLDVCVWNSVNNLAKLMSCNGSIHSDQEYTDQFCSAVNQMGGVDQPVTYHTVGHCNSGDGRSWQFVSCGTTMDCPTTVTVWSEAWACSEIDETTSPAAADTVNPIVIIVGSII